MENTCTFHWKCNFLHTCQSSSSSTRASFTSILSMSLWNPGSADTQCVQSFRVHLVGNWMPDSLITSYALGDTLERFKDHLRNRGFQRIPLFLFALRAATWKKICDCLLINNRSHSITCWSQKTRRKSDPGKALTSPLCLSITYVFSSTTSSSTLRCYSTYQLQLTERNASWTCSTHTLNAFVVIIKRVPYKT